MKKFSTARLVALTTLAATAGAAQASDISAAALGTLSPATFRLLSEDLSAAVSYKPLVPAESLGMLGFDVGVSVGGTKLAHRDAFRAAAGGASVPSIVPLVAARAHKGLPFDLDVGLAVGALPGTNVRTYGGELRWAVLPGGVALPAIAVRGALSNLSGVEGLKLNTRSVDVSISKGFLMVTPYVGVGQVWTKSEATISGGQHASESFNKSKVFAGVNLNLGFNLAFETDKTGDTTSYGIKMGVRF